MNKLQEAKKFVQPSPTEGSFDSLQKRFDCAVDTLYDKVNCVEEKFQNVLTPPRINECCPCDEKSQETSPIEMWLEAKLKTIIDCTCKLDDLNDRSCF